MKNSKTVPTKKVSSTTKKVVAKKTNNKVIAKVVNKTATKKQFKTDIYTTTFYNGVKEDKHKTHRGTQRRTIFKLYDTIFMTNKKEGMRSTKELKEYSTSKEFKTLVKSFKSMYKTNYILNDFSIKSLYKGNDETRIKELNKVLSFISDSIGTKKTTTKKIKEVVKK